MGVVNWRHHRPLVLLFGVCTLLKLLLLAPGLYHSTDFEVHRNWLAVTHSLPLKRWYWEDTSEWTLDYPPLFGFFEWLLSQVAATVEPELVKIVPYYHPSPAAIWFQRISVMVTDGALVFGVMAWCGTLTRRKKQEPERASPGSSSSVGVGALILLHSGLIMVDHIHFQYNGFLLGLLVLSVGLIKHDRVLLGGAAFSCLLMLKHLFLSLAPLYFVYLLRSYCCCCRNHLSALSTAENNPQNVSPKKFRNDPQEDRQRDPRDGSGIVPRIVLGNKDADRGGSTSTQRRRRSTAALFGLSDLSVVRVAALGAVVVGVFACVLGPLCVSDGFSVTACEKQLVQLGKRLFPFGRGLVHAYWAPNAWALYLFADRLLLTVLKCLGVAGAPEIYVGSTTGGLVRSEVMAVLPAVPASACLLLSLLACLPALVRAWKRPTPTVFTWGLVHCSLSSFLVGFHVHEKALLIPAVMSALSAFNSTAEARVHLRLSFLSAFSVFPLLPGPELMVLKVLLVAAHLLMAISLLQYTGFSQQPPAAWSSASSDSPSAVVTRAMTMETRSSTSTTSNKGSPTASQSSAVSEDNAAVAAAATTTTVAVAEKTGSLASVFASSVLVTAWDKLYVLGACSVFIFEEMVHPWLFGVGGVLGEGVLPFLPLMLHSVYGAIGVAACWTSSTLSGGC